MKRKIFRRFFKKFDNCSQIMYNIAMERFTIAIIGGGASGLMLATALSSQQNIALLERGERLGRKLSSTGNGQGNVTNAHAKEEMYFSSCVGGDDFAREKICRYDEESFAQFLGSKGLLLITDERGRVYPAGRQASAVTDALRFDVAQKGVKVFLNTNITRIQTAEKTTQGFILKAETPDGAQEFYAENVVLCAGGKAAKNFGTDGTAYALAEKFGHTITSLYPSLVQLKTDTTHTKTLKGIRVNDGVLTAFVNKNLDTKEKGAQGRLTIKGDIIFTDYGISGDAVFRISAFIADEIAQGKVDLSIDFLPDFDESAVYNALLAKQKAFPSLAVGELLCGMVNNQIGRAILKRANGDLKKAAVYVKNFPLTATGSLGFDYAQVTKGGIRLDEVDENLQSRFVKGLYFAGEILDVDGQCGGFNLQWAYSSAMTVAAALNGDEKACKKIK